MTTFIDTETMEWPLHEADLFLRYGAEIPASIHRLIILPQEGAISGQTYDRNHPIQVDGDWILTWTIRDKTSEELQKEKEIEDEFSLFFD